MIMGFNPAAERGLLKTEFGHVHYKVTSWDAEKPAIVCLHMSPRSMDEYSDVTPLLSDKYSVIAIDFLGLGASDDLDYFGMEPLSIAQHGSYVLAVLDKLGVSKATACGNLFGSFVAAYLTATNPDRFTSLILVHPLLHTPEGFEGYKGWVTKFKDAASPAHQVSEEGKHWEAVWKRRTSRLTAELNTRVGQDELRGRGHDWIFHYARIAFNMEEHLAMIKVPTLVIWGDECVKLMDMFGFGVGARKDEVKTLLGTDAEKVEQMDFEEASLQLINQKAPEFAEAVTNFLAKH